MSIWKSPVFYFGIVLLLVVTLALAAPFLVPWNNYRGDLENFGQKLTGRTVSIDGDVAVKLFPWPQLEARDVAIGNPEGFPEGAFISADVLRVNLSLAGLFSGSLDVTSVDADRPNVNLQRNASGQVNWYFAPTEKVAGEGLLSRVKLDKISLTNGIVSYDDLRLGHSTIFSDLNASLSAQTILGPWRMGGTVKWKDVPLNLTISTNEKQAGVPLKFGVKMSPVDTTFPNTAVDGAWDGATFKGFVRVEPQQQGAKGSSEGTLKPLAMQANVDATTERVSLLKIKIAPADRKDSGTLIEGDAVVEFGSETVSRLDLRSPRINLDTLVGAGAMQQWRDGGFLWLANRVLKSTPPKTVADYRLAVSTLTSGGQALNDVRLSGSIQSEAIRVKEFAAELPGRSAAVFDGIIFPGDLAAQLGGKFKFESGDTRAFLSWLDPRWKAALEKHWTGSRGRIEIPFGNVDWTGERFALGNVAYRFEGEPGNATLSAQWGAKKTVEIIVNADRINLDSLAPNGWSVIRDGGLPSIVAAMTKDSTTDGWERSFGLRASSILLNGVTAQEVGVNTLSYPKGFEIKYLDIGSVSGARLKGGGAVIDKGKGPEGEISFKLEAQDPRGFIRLMGLESVGSSWSSELGQTNLHAKIMAEPQNSGTELRLEAQGTSGPLDLTVAAKFDELEKAENMKIAASGRVSSKDSSALAQLVGLAPQMAVGPGDVAFDFNGTMDQNFAFSTTVKALGGVAVLEGTASPKQPWFGISGKFKANATDGQALAQALGIPVATPTGQVLDLNAVVVAKEGVLSLLDVTGHVVGHKISGAAQVSVDGKLQGDFETDQLDARDVMALAFMPWEGQVQDEASSFAAIDKDSLSAEVFIRPQQFETITADPRQEVVVGLGFGKTERLLSIKSPGEQGLKADVALKPRGASFDMEGHLRWPVDLARVMTAEQGASLAKGELLAQGEFKASGRSPAAVLAALEGKGTYGLSNAALPQLTLTGFSTAIVGAQTPDALTRALKEMRSEPGTAIGQRVGSFTIANGATVLAPFDFVADGVTARVTPVFDLSSRQIAVETSLQLAARPDLPPVTVTYEGTPYAITVRNGTAALAAKLGYELLSKEMADLERLQKEQEALAAKEEAQRKLDELRFAEYQSTRAELREFAGVRRFHRAQREKADAGLKSIVEFAVRNGPAISRIELLRHARRLQVRRTQQ